MKTTISTRGQIVLPAEIRRKDQLRPGQELEVERIGPGQYRLTMITPPPNQGVVDWLLSCPEKDFFTPIDSESTDTL